MKQILTQEAYLEVIDSFSEVLFDLTTAEDVAWAIVDHVIAKLGYEDCVIYLYSEYTKCLIQTAAFGPKNVENRRIKDPIVIEPGEGIVGRVFQYGTGRIVNDTSRDSNYIIDDRFRLSEIAIPIKYDETVIGVIDSEHSSEDFFTEQDLELLTTIADMVAIRIYAIRS